MKKVIQGKASTPNLGRKVAVSHTGYASTVRNSFLNQDDSLDIGRLDLI